MVKYINGAACSNHHNERFSTEIAFICDKEAGDGWPLFVRQE
jgi:hypothetical protein